MKYGYYLVETAGAISAALLIRGKALGWVLGLAASTGPMTGYVLSRTVGVPGDSSLRRIARHARVPQAGR